MHSKCFVDFSLTADGTPTHGEHFCIMIRLVTLEWKIVELVLRCRVYDGSFDTDKLAHTMLSTLEVDYQLKPENWRCFMADRAATNTAALRKIVSKCRLNVLEAPCISHGLSNAGKAFQTPSWNFVSLKLSALVKYKMCKAKTVFRETFFEDPMKGGGVRWWQQYEQAVQVDRLG